jgi:hypothetical protein
MSISPRSIRAYGCGSPIRLPIVHALALGSKADYFYPEENPIYQGGDSIVWGLIRGAREIMIETNQSGRIFYQIDNAYFGRNIYYRITKNALQLSQISDQVTAHRRESIFKELGLRILPWNNKRNGPIILCLSSSHLYEFYGANTEAWITSTIAQIRRFSDREIIIRDKDLDPSNPIQAQINNAWCVVTHVSAAALDALLLGIPVITTGHCAASPLSTTFELIENPPMSEGREELFASLSWGQFTPAEMLNGFAWNILTQDPTKDPLAF